MRGTLRPRCENTPRRRLLVVASCPVVSLATSLLEILKIFVVALVALTMLILLIGVGRELLRRGLGPVAVDSIAAVRVADLAAVRVSRHRIFLGLLCLRADGGRRRSGHGQSIRHFAVESSCSPAMMFAALLSPPPFTCRTWRFPGAARGQPCRLDVDRGHRLPRSCTPSIPTRRITDFRFTFAKSQGRTLIRSDGDGPQRRAERPDEACRRR